MSDLYKEPAYKLSDEDQEELKEEGNYLALQELDNPFQGQTDEDSLSMTYRYGYEVIDEKPTLHHHTKDGTGLKVTYQKVDDDTDKLVYVNPAFYFPKVIQVQTTIFPTIGRSGGDEFERAKAI